MRKGDTIIRFNDTQKTYQWAYCIKDSENIEDGFESGNYEPVFSKESFLSREETITELNKYIKENNLKSANILN